MQDLGRHKEAPAESEKIIELEPENYDGYYSKSLVFIFLEEYHSAIIYAQRVLDKKPDNKAVIAHLHQIIGVAKRRVGDLPGAKSAFLEALNGQPSTLNYANLINIASIPDFVQFGTRIFNDVGAEVDAVWALNFGKVGLGPKLGAGYAHDTVYADQTFDLMGGATLFYKGNILLIGADAGIGRSFSLVEDERHKPAVNGWFYDYGVYSYVSVGCPCLRLGAGLSIQQDVSDNELTFKVVPGISAVFWW